MPSLRHSQKPAPQFIGRIVCQRLYRCAKEHIWICIFVFLHLCYLRMIAAGILIGIINVPILFEKVFNYMPVVIVVSSASVSPFWYGIFGLFDGSFDCNDIRGGQPVIQPHDILLGVFFQIIANREHGEFCDLGLPEVVTPEVIHCLCIGNCDFLFLKPRFVFVLVSGHIITPETMTGNAIRSVVGRIPVQSMFYLVSMRNLNGYLFYVFQQLYIPTIG